MWRKFIKVRTRLVIESRNISFTCSSHKFWPGQPQNCTPFHWKVHSLNTKYSFTCPIFLFLVRFKIWDNIILKQIRQRFFYHSDQAVLGIKILLKTKLNFEKRLWKCERIWLNKVFDTSSIHINLLRKFNMRPWHDAHVNQEKGGLGGRWKARLEVKLRELISPAQNYK